MLWLLLNFLCSFFFFNDTATTEIYTLSLHDALPILTSKSAMRLSPERTRCSASAATSGRTTSTSRSEEHTSELQSRFDLVCRLLLEKKKTKKQYANYFLTKTHRHCRT